MEWKHMEDIPVDREIIGLFKEQGITELYPPQAEALPLALNGKNVVLSVPTASGKSLVAYITILDAALKGKKSMYIVPLRALASEKWEDLQPFKKLGIKVGISTGDLDSKGGHLARNDIIICTSEKADSLLRHGAGWLNELEIIVADEIHLINDFSRGPTLEMVLSRLRMMNPEIQIIALSATIRNAEEIAEWLDAELIQSEWRPVPLKEGVLYKNKIYFTDESVKEIEGSKASNLVTDVVSEKGQALVFVNSRRSAQMFAENLKEEVSHFITEEERKELRKAKKSALSGEEKNIISKKLAECVENGVAFHHAGLSNNQRKVVETYFKKGILKCIVATPTLAAGVNTPARRVIMKDIWRYSQAEGYMVPLPVMEVKQAMGRAGRPGYDTVGEAVLIAKNDVERERLINNYLMAEVEPIYSKLGSEPALRTHILALIATDFAVTWDEIEEFLEKTFYAHQMGVLQENKIENILEFLEEGGFVARRRERWDATLFGRKTSSLYIDPLSALKMREALEGGEGDEFSYLHAICATPDMRCVYVSKKDGWIEEKMGAKKFLIEPPPSFSPDYEWFLAELKTAFLLEDWINEVSEDEIIKKYQVGPGDIHNKVETAEWLLHAMQELARIFNFDAVPMLTKLIMRMRYGCKEELLNLVQLRGIGRVRARALYNAGLKSVNDLRKASIERIAGIKHIGKGIAKSIKEQI
ncbi:MAG: restriction endonuclease subunit R [Thermoplasmata archaeon]|nr:MAG: restriction endonuclease subunit R [Thermoplasmata archaeon]